MLIPREKPVPVAKPMTKWQSYAKDHGIEKKKKSKIV
jgi:regulator of ribosome biosynthesis